MEAYGADKLRENKLDWLPEKDDLLDLCKLIVYDDGSRQ